MSVLDLTVKMTDLYLVTYVRLLQLFSLLKPHPCKLAFFIVLFQ